MRSHRFGKALRALWQAGSLVIVVSVMLGLLGGIVSHIIPTAGARDISASAIAVVSAASYEATVAPDSIAAIFGSNLATQTAVGGDSDPNTSGIQLPTQLAGTTVEVNGQRAQLFFVSPTQVNFLLPGSTTTGAANVVVKTSNGTNSTGTTQVADSAPALFTLNGSGTGVVAANILRVKANGTQTYEDVFQYNTVSSRFVTRAIDLGPATDKVFLILYGTGLRYAGTPGNFGDVSSSIRILIGSEQKTPQFAGPNPSLVGVDQINIEIPRTLIGRGVIGVTAAAVGYTASNLVDIEVSGALGTAPPQVQLMTSDPVLAGTELGIAGSGFVDTDKNANQVKIGGVDAKVMSATTSLLRVVVPYGAETGQVTVTTPQGTGRSSGDLRVKTSISGVVENTSRQALSNVTVCIEALETADKCHPTIRTVTSDEGVFVLPDVLQGVHNVRIDGSSIPVSPPYPTPVRRQEALANRDNPFTSVISLQQPTGSSGTIGGSSFAEDGSGSTGLRTLAVSPDSLVKQLSQSFTVSLLQQLPQQIGLSLQTGTLGLTFPLSLGAVFSSGATRGTVYLTPIPNGRTPVPLPPNVYSESIAQITPFGTKLTPGAKLTFANTENHQVGAKLVLYRYDYEKGDFGTVDGATLTVSADRTKIETGATDVKDTSIYFVGLPRTSLATVTGRVLCCELPDGTVKDTKPVAKATVRVRGQLVVTDGDGAFIARNVAASVGENIKADVSFLRADGRADVAVSREVAVTASTITNLGNIVLPPENSNRPPVILAANRLEIDAGKTLDVPLSIYDPDTGQTVNARLNGPSWAFLCKTCRIPGTQPVPNAYILQLRPSSTDKTSTITITADDFTPSSGDRPTATTSWTMTVVVNNLNRPPTADEQSIDTDEDKPVVIKLTGSDPDAGTKLLYEIVRQPASGTLSGALPSLTYTPRANFNGSDSFSFRVTDGIDFSLAATVKIAVRSINDAPVLTAPATATIAEGQALTLNLSASDVDTGQTLVLTGTGLPSGATLTTTSPTTAQFRWTPSFVQAGTYTVSFKATDNGSPALSDSKDVRITVTDTPTLSMPSAQSGTEGQLLVFDVATSLSAPDAVIAAANLPTGAALTSRGGGVWQFRWTPANDQAGVYTVSFRLSTGGSVVESRDLRITIADVLRDFNKELADLTILGAQGLLPLSATDLGDATGTSLAVGDINGDGVSDLVIGAPNANSELVDAGKAYVFFGKAALAGTIDLAQQTPDLIILGEKAYDGFGASLAIGDVTGDGRADLMIGAPLADQLDRKDSGKIYMIQAPLKTDNLPASKALIVNQLASLTVLGAKSGDQFGASLAVGALNEKTGALDLVAGAPGYDAREGNDAGAVYGFWGGTALAGNLDLAQGVSSFTITGVAANAQAGKSLAIGNFNGDDFADIAIGAPAAPVGAGRANGAVYLVQSASKLARSSTLLEVAPFPLEGERDGDTLGTSVAFGDFDGDGLSDLAIGVPGSDGADATRRNSGKVMVLFGARVGATMTRLLTVNGAGSKDDLVSDEFGTSVAFGDYNGDGVADLLAGAPGYDTSIDKRDALGAAYLILGSRSSVTTTYDLATRAADLLVVGLDPGDRLGQGALAIGNVNGGTGTAAINDLLFGIPRAYSLNNARGEAGEVRVIFGMPR